MIRNKELDGIIIAADTYSPFTREAIKFFKTNSIPKVGILHPQHPDLKVTKLEEFIYFLDPDKFYMPYLETHVIDGCNLNCERCVHFSPLYNENDVYELETFKRDMRRVSQVVDVITIRLLGGEPLLKSDFEEYLNLTRYYFPKSDLHIITNALLIPSAPQSLMDTLHRNRFIVDISMYPPTVNIFEKIKNRLQENGIPFTAGEKVETFRTLITLSNDHNPSISSKNCGCSPSRFIRDGKLYKCPVDIMSRRFKEKFNIKNFPSPTGIDIYAENFVSLIELLDRPVEHCSWCNESTPRFPWKASKRHTKEEWLAN